MKLPVLLGMLGLGFGLSFSVCAQPVLVKKLERYSSEVASRMEQIPLERKELLTSVSEMIISETAKNGKAQVVFLEETNSGTSQLAQVLLHLALSKNNVATVNVLSAGNSVKAIDENCIHLLKEVGYKVDVNKIFKENPRYIVHHSWKESGLLIFSKEASNFQIPSSDVISIRVDESKANSILTSGEVVLSYGSVSKETFEQIAVEMHFLANKVVQRELLSHKE